MKQKSAFDIFTKPICWNEIKKRERPALSRNDTHKYSLQANDI